MFPVHVHACLIVYSSLYIFVIMLGVFLISFPLACSSDVEVFWYCRFSQFFVRPFDLEFICRDCFHLIPLCFTSRYCSLQSMLFAGSLTVFLTWPFAVRPWTFLEQLIMTCLFVESLISVSPHLTFLPLQLLFFRCCCLQWPFSLFEEHFRIHCRVFQPGAEFPARWIHQVYIVNDLYCDAGTFKFLVNVLRCEDDDVQFSFFLQFSFSFPSVGFCVDFWVLQSFNFRFVSSSLFLPFFIFQFSWRSLFRLSGSPKFQDLLFFFSDVCLSFQLQWWLRGLLVCWQ